MQEWENGKESHRQTGGQAGADAVQQVQQVQRQHIDLMNKKGYKPAGAGEWVALPLSHALHCHETRRHWGISGRGMQVSSTVTVSGWRLAACCT